jgi:hypothetical protein
LAFFWNRPGFTAVAISVIAAMWMVVGVIPTSLPAAAAPVAPVLPVELLVAPLAGAVVVELPLGWLDDELHAPAAMTAASAIVKSAKERTRTKRARAEVALVRPRATVLPLAMVILHPAGSVPAS